MKVSILQIIVFFHRKVIHTEINYKGEVATVEYICLSAIELLKGSGGHEENPELREDWGIGRKRCLDVLVHGDSGDVDEFGDALLKGLC